MINNAPNISVILPVFNGERFIHEALSSICAQNYPNLELILIDDGSSDNTAQVATTFFSQPRNIEFSYYYQANAGVAAARNLGLEHVKNELIAFLDVDDLWPSGKLELHLEHFAKNPKLSAVLGHTQFMKIDPISGQKKQEVNCPQMLLGAGLYKRYLFDQVGLFDTSLMHGEDWDWFLRCREASIEMKVFSQTSLIYHRHSDNLSLQKKRSQSDLMRLMKQSLDRRRGIANTHNNDNNDAAKSLTPWANIIDSSES